MIAMPSFLTTFTLLCQMRRGIGPPILFDGLILSDIHTRSLSRDQVSGLQPPTMSLCFDEERFGGFRFCSLYVCLFGYLACGYANFACTECLSFHYPNTSRRLFLNPPLLLPLPYPVHNTATASSSPSSPPQPLNSHPLACVSRTQSQTCNA